MAIGAEEFNGLDTRHVGPPCRNYGCTLAKHARTRAELAVLVFLCLRSGRRQRKRVERAISPWPAVPLASRCIVDGRGHTGLPQIVRRWTRLGF